MMMWDVAVLTTRFSMVLVTPEMIPVMNIMFKKLNDKIKMSNAAVDLLPRVIDLNAIKMPFAEYLSVLA